MFKIGNLFIRKMDPKGRLTLGADVLKEAGIPKDSLLRLEVENGKIVIGAVSVQIEKGE